MSCWKKYLACRQSKKKIKRKLARQAQINGFSGEKQRRFRAAQFAETSDHLILAEPAGAADPVEELAAGGVLHDDGQVRGREHDLGFFLKKRTRPPNE
jgi:ABC-type Mn2+/Zn2+ transport system ATPase subunit